MNCFLSTHCRNLEASFSVGRAPDRNKEDRAGKKDGTSNEGYAKVGHAIPADFCRVFEDHLDDFYTLSLLLTGDPVKAEQCFVSGLEDCTRGNPVFREWAQSWGRRMVVKSAIRVIRPSRISKSTMLLPDDSVTADGISKRLSKVEARCAAIMRLQPFDRFVYVLSVLERYSDRECSMLLECNIEKVVDARIRALQQLADTSQRAGLAEGALDTTSGMVAIQVSEATLSEAPAVSQE